MSKYFILYENSLYNINLKNNTLEYINPLMNNLQDMTKNGICLIGGNDTVNSDGKYYINKYENKLPLHEMMKKMASDLGVLVLEDISYIVTKVKPENEEFDVDESEYDELYYFNKKTEIERIFRLYEFQSIYPLDYILYSMSTTEEIKAICTQTFMYMKQFKNLQNVVYTPNYFTRKELNDKDSFDFNEYLGIASDKPKLVIFGTEQLDKIDENLNEQLIQKPFTIFIEAINSNEKFKFQDKYSLYYKSKKIKPYIILINIPLAILAGWFGFQYVQKAVNTTFYQNKITEYNSLISKTSNNIKENKKKDIIQYHQPIDLKYFNVFAKIIQKVDETGELIYPNIKLYDLNILRNNGTEEIAFKIITNNKDTIRKLATDFKGSYSNLLFKDDGKEFEIVLKLQIEKEDK